MRRALCLLGIALYRLGLARLVIRCRPMQVRVVRYHHISTQHDTFIDGLGVSIDRPTLARHLDYYRKHYTVVPMRDVLRGTLPPGALVISFDDGYRSVRTAAFPLLSERNMPACVYLVERAVRGQLLWTNLVNHALHSEPELAWRVLREVPELTRRPAGADIVRTLEQSLSPARLEALCRALRRNFRIGWNMLYLDADDIQLLRQRGLDFGFHSRDHVNLSLCKDGELQHQIDPSGLAELVNLPSFAIPAGVLDSRVEIALHRQGFRQVMNTVGTTGFQAVRISQLSPVSPTGDTAAKLFSQLEVVEPLINWASKLGSAARSRSLSAAPALFRGSSGRFSSLATQSPAATNDKGPTEVRPLNASGEPDVQPQEDT